MSYIDEIIYDNDDFSLAVDVSHVARRVDDWLHRLDDLYAGISAWADRHGWMSCPGLPIVMSEELMQKAGLAPRQQATLVLTTPAGERVWVKPKGLWIIGANGRVDLYGSNEMAMLVDEARPFASPLWTMHFLPSRPEGGQLFDPAVLASMV